MNNKMKQSEGPLDVLFHKEMFDENLRATLVRKPQNSFHPTFIFVTFCWPTMRPRVQKVYIVMNKPLK